MGDKFDGLFMTAVQQAQGIENFFDHLFSFFGRKTDLYSQEERAYTMINSYITKHIGEFKQNVEKQQAIEKAKKEAADKAKAERAAKEAAEKARVEEADDAQCMEVTEEEAALIEAQEQARNENPAAATEAERQATENAAATEENKDAAEGEEENKEEEKGERPNAGNGGTTDRYSWEQTLVEVTVNIEIPEGITSKQLTVDISKTHLKVGIKGQPLMIDGDFHKQVKKGDSIWCIETLGSGKRILQLTLTKRDQQNWWSTVI